MEAEKYLENHELYSDIIHWKHISIIMKDYKDSLLEEIEKSLMSNTEADIESFDNIDGDYFNTHERSIVMNNFKDGLYLQRNITQAVINKLKKG